MKDILFMLIHNVLPTRDRLYRLRKCNSSQCSALDGEENVEHLFTSCSRTQVAWAWARRKIMNLMIFDDKFYVVASVEIEPDAEVSREPEKSESSWTYCFMISSSMPDLVV